jgi:hypothetical protein
VGVGAAHLHEPLGVAVAIEVPHHVRAQQGKGVPAARFIPQLFQTNRRIGVSIAPEQIDHLPVSPDPRRVVVVAHQLRHETGDLVTEELGVRHLIDHEPREHLARVEQHELATGKSVRPFALFHAIQEPFGVARARDHHNTIPSPEPVRQELRNGVDDEFIVFVKLNRMRIRRGSDELARSCGPLLIYNHGKLQHIAHVVHPFHARAAGARCIIKPSEARAKARGHPFCGSRALVGCPGRGWPRPDLWRICAAPSSRPLQKRAHVR